MTDILYHYLIESICQPEASIQKTSFIYLWSCDQYVGTFWICSVGCIPVSRRQGGLLPSPFRRPLPKGTGACQLSAATPSESGSLGTQATALPGGVRGRQVWGPAVQEGGGLWCMRTGESEKGSQGSVLMRGMCGGGRRGASDTSGLGQPDREFRVTPGNKAHTTAQPHHVPDSGKGRENDSVAPRAPESLAGALKSRFPHTRGRREGDPGRGAQGLEAGTVTTREFSLLVSHFPTDVRIHLPDPRALQWDWKDGGWPQPTPSLPAWVGPMWAVQLGWNLRLTHSETLVFLLGSYGEGLFHAEPTVSIFSHLPARLHIPDNATYKCTEPLHSLFGGLR